MLEAKFVNYDLKLIEPSFNSSLTDLIIELDYLRKKPLGGSTHPKVFFQLKHIFHTLESIGSARIEGNNTTIAEYIETKLEDNKNVSSDIKEIQNIEKAMEFIEDNILDYPINKMFLSELHKMIVDGLLPPPNGEGDRTPGLYRGINLKINKSNHLPPDYLVVNDYMLELLDFIERKDSPKYDLLKAAIAHHRFVWIHPFGNGNGRTVR
jgi:Fic family protein